LPEGDLLYALIAGVVVLFAGVAAWAERRAERRDAHPHRRVLRSEPSYRRHVARRGGDALDEED